jgi:hypothetical protein
MQEYVSRSYHVREQRSWIDMAWSGKNDKRLTVHRLINEASIKSKQSGERGISARSVRKVSETTLRKYKG